MKLYGPHGSCELHKARPAGEGHGFLQLLQGLLLLHLLLLQPLYQLQLYGTLQAKCIRHQQLTIVLTPSICETNPVS